MDPFIGQIQPFGFNFNPRGWEMCNGQLVAIASNTALFSLIGTIYGGDGRTTFALPDLRGRAMLHQGRGPGLSDRPIGQRTGTEMTTLNILNLPYHNHSIIQGTGAGQVNLTVHTVDNGNDSNESDNGANALGTSGNMSDIYRSDPGATIDTVAGVSISGETSYEGGQQQFNNIQPYQVVNICIAMQGIFPTRS